MKVFVIAGESRSHLYPLVKVMSKQLMPIYDKSSVIRLNANMDVFVRFRYSYEMKGYKINATFLLKLMNVLSKLCDDSYPKEITNGHGTFYKCGSLVNGVSYRIEIE